MIFKRLYKSVVKIQDIIIVEMTIKPFNGRQIQTRRDNNHHKWCFSIVDFRAFLSGSCDLFFLETSFNKHTTDT